MDPLIIVHGGAGSIPQDAIEARLAGVRQAAGVAWELLRQGRSAVEACEAAVVALEDDENFNAGRGSVLNQQGRVQMDALIMEGHTLRAGGVGCVEHLRNPIRAARKVLEESPHIYLVGAWAERFVQEQGIPLCANQELITARELERFRRAREQVQLRQPPEFDPALPHDTVGAVALDRQGHIAAATSTGGTINKTPGRVGDSSLIGCGCYADNESAAVSTTGWGEAMMKLVLGKWAVDRVRSGILPQPAAEEALAFLERRLKAHGGLILLDAQGHRGVAHSTPHMPWALRTTNEEQSGIRAYG